MSDLIPPEILANILLRVGTNHLVYCRSVSKQWLSIIDDPQFIRNQLEYSANSSNSALFLQDRALTKVFYWNSHAISSGNGSFFSTPPMRYKPTQKLVLTGSCHGLLCFSLSKHPHADFVILNRSTGERHTLKTTNPSKELDDNSQVVARGFGYDELSDDYKVVRILVTIPVDPNIINGSYIAEIYGVRSKGFFRSITLPASEWNLNSYIGKSIGVFFGTSLHWADKNPSHTEDAIHAIDLVSNTYRKLQFPQITSNSFGQIWGSFSVGIVDRRLCILCVLKHEREVGMIWVMEEYGNRESWNRIYCIRNAFSGYPWSYPPACLGKHADKVILMINPQRLAWFDATKKNADGSSCLTIDEKICYDFQEAIWCQDSLVKIFPKEEDAQLPNDVKKEDAYDKKRAKHIWSMMKKFHRRIVARLSSQMICCAISKQ